MTIEHQQPSFRFESSVKAETLTKPEIARLTKIAIDAALSSANIVHRAFHGIPLEDLQIEWKKDATPKTIADVEGDLAIVRIIRKARPQDDIRIEESGFHKGVVEVNKDTGSFFVWEGDSLDGTRPFVEKKPESTVGVVCLEREGNYVGAAIVHPGRKQLAFTMRGMGAFIGNLEKVNGEFHPVGKMRKLEVSPKTSFNGATVCVDSLFTTANSARKHAFMLGLEELSKKDGRITLSYDMTGSNIAYELEVARGGSLLGITDAKGGNWDWRVGQAFIEEAGGAMIDPTTGKKPTEDSEVVIYGNPEIVALALPIAGQVYEGYTGFNS